MILCTAHGRRHLRVPALQHLPGDGVHGRHRQPAAGVSGRDAVARGHPAASTPLSPLLPLLLLGFPVLDTLTVMVERIAAGRSPFSPGQEPLPPQADAAGALPHRGGGDDLRDHRPAGRCGLSAALPLGLASDRALRRLLRRWWWPSSPGRTPRVPVPPHGAFSTSRSRAGSRSSRTSSC